MMGGAIETKISGGPATMQVLALVFIVDKLITTFISSQNMIETSRAQRCFRISVDEPSHQLMVKECQWQPLRSLN